MTDPLDNLQRIVTRRGTKAQVEAEAGGALEEVRFAYATDTSEFGIYTNATWTWIGAGATSPLTTKGDLHGYDTADARVPVGANTYLLVADSADAQGVIWKDPQTTGHWEPLMDGGSPYAPLDDGSGTDWLFVWVA